MPVTGYKVKDSILMDLEEQYNIKSELWNDIRILLTEKYDVSHSVIFDMEITIDDAVKALEEVIEVSRKVDWNIKG
jgi:hypothetical protein